MLLLAVSTPSHALQCFEPSPSVREGKDAYDAITPTRLSSDERKSITRIFQRLAGRWSGKTNGYFCRGTTNASRKEANDYSVELTARSDSADELSLVSDLVSADGTTTRTERLRLFLSADALRLDSNDPGSGVEILSLSSSGNAMVFLHKVFVRNADVGVRVTEVQRRIEVSGTRLQIDYQVYLGGVLSSASSWVLSRK